MTGKKIRLLRPVAVMLVVAVCVTAAVATVVPIAAANDGFEPNDDFDSAASISTGTYGGLEIDSGESDFFAVHLGPGEEYTATIDFAHDTGDLDLAVYSPNRTELETSESLTDSESVTITAPVNGTYYVEVYGFLDASAPYELTSSINSNTTDSTTNTTTENDAYEPNDAFSSATYLNDSGSYDGLEIVDGESDFYSMWLAEDQTLVSTIEFDDDTGDLDMAVYGPNHTQLGISDSLTDFEAVNITAATAGTYYLEVYGFSGASAPYTLNLDRSSQNTTSGSSTNTTDRNDGFEPNDNFTSAVPLTGTYEDLYVDTGDSDYFAVPLDPGDGLSASIDFDHGTGDLDMRVYAPDRALLDASISVNDGESLSVSDAENGTYFVEVYGYSGASAPYDLTIQTTSGSSQTNTTQSTTSTPTPTSNQTSGGKGGGSDDTRNSTTTVAQNASASSQTTAESTGEENESDASIEINVDSGAGAPIGFGFPVTLVALLVVFLILRR